MLVAWIRKQDRWFWLQLALFVLFAWRSYDVFFPDEYAQVVGFASLKLGYSHPTLGDMPWEYGEQIRPWFQPTIYFALLRVAEALGITNPFSQTFVLRLFTGVLYLSGLRCLIIVGRRTLPQAGHHGLVFLTANIGFLYYFGVRHSSETMSAIFLSWCFYCLSEPEGTWTISPKRLFFAGVLAGFAFESRYQTAFALVGLALWYLLFHRPSIPAALACLFGAACAIGIGTCCDAWGYGHWVFAPYRYYYANIVQGFAASMGNDPFFAYLYELPANYFLPVSLLSLVSMFVFWGRHPRHPLTWASATMFLCHSAIAHKEERFMFPLLPFVPLFIVGAWLPSASPRWVGATNWLWSRRKGGFAKFVLGWNYLAIAFLLCLTGSRVSALPSQRWMLGHLPEGTIVWHSFARIPGVVGLRGVAPTDPPPFYNRGQLHIFYSSEQAEVCAAWASGRRDIYLYSAHLLQPNELPFATEFCHSDFPFARNESVRSWATGATRWYDEQQRYGLPQVRWYSVYRLVSDPCAQN